MRLKGGFEVPVISLKIRWHFNNPRWDIAPPQQNVLDKKLN